MSLDVFVPPGRLQAGVSADVAPRVNSAQFGDGYSQRSSDGLNADNQTFSGQFPSLSPANSKAVRDFFSAHKSTPFLYALQLDAQQRKWIASKWSRTFVATNREAISFTLTEVFDL